MKKGLDISKHQAYFEAKTAAAQGISTVICRCSYGTGKDSCWDAFAPAVQAAAMQLGAYGFLTAHYTSRDQFDKSPLQARPEKQRSSGRLHLLQERNLIGAGTGCPNVLIVKLLGEKTSRAAWMNRELLQKLRRKKKREIL